ncbi:hypothetical protein AB6A23_07165 [Paenibacillus tarimensis]
MSPGKTDGIRLNRLGEQGERPAGLTWGVPWPIGQLQRDELLALLDTEGKPVPVQSWPAAYWPDGSVKWTAHAAVIGEKGARQMTVMKGASPVVEQTLEIIETQHSVEVDTGILVCRFNRAGRPVVREILREGKRVCSGGELTGLREARSTVSGRTVITEEPFHGVVSEVTVEQNGPLRAVIKITGRHELNGGMRKWLPFTLRFYFYAGMDDIRMLHTFVYDGNPHQEFIKGLGVRFYVPMSGPLYNRHVRLAGDTGWFAESPKGLMTFRLTDEIAQKYKQQMRGEDIAFDPAEEKDAAFLALLDDSAIWNDFKLNQLSADSYQIVKRTQEGCSWIRAAAGRRARGFVYVGSEGGGIGIGVRSFWQQSPAALHVHNTAEDEAAVTAWFWSPDAGAMDLRHYDTRTHVASAYEGADELRSTPYGVAHTTECMLWCRERTPNQEELGAMAKRKESPPLLVCEPQYYYASRTLGVWSLPDRSTPLKAQLEETLDDIVSFYQKEIEQRSWYGFWDYGDLMHSYDPVRHTWRYDIGGCAWQNTELAPNIWLWYMFLRSGREDIFRMAEAMARHTSETDVYHIGEYAGLGSRHNVLHWGCGCKEARIGMAGLHKFYYYLTADERIGDIMDEVKDADYATVGIDPMRAYFPKDEFPTHTRSGPDWAAFCSNWLVQWERYEDTAYRNKMLTGIECLKQMPHRLLTGPVFGYDPKSGQLTHMGHENYGHHLIICMGGAQVWTEMAQLLQDPEWSDMLSEFGEFYNLSAEEKSRRTSGDIVGKQWNIPMLSTAMMAFSAAHRGNADLAREAWNYLIGQQSHWNIGFPLTPQPVPAAEYVRPIEEVPSISTNTASQWSINVIVCLELIGEYLEQ